MGAWLALVVALAPAALAGRTAGDAYVKMVTGATWVSASTPRCNGGSLTWTPATVTNACARTR